MVGNDIMLFQAGNVPAHLQQAFTETNIEDRSTVPSLSPSGKVWTIAYEGTKTKMERNVDGDIVPVGVMRVILLDYAKRRGRSYYEGAYNPEAESAPVCWSEDGVTPDPTSLKLQSPKCATCPRAIKGSKVTDTGKQTAECSTHRMLAVMPVVGSKFFPHALRLKIAVTSDFDKQSPGEEKEGWRAFQQYTDFLKANGVTHTAMLVTKMKFDQNATYPKIFFQADRWLSAEEITQVKPFTVDAETTKLLGGSWTPAGVDGVRADEAAVVEQTPTPPLNAPAAEVVAELASTDDEAGEIIMTGLDEPAQAPAQAATPAPAPVKPEPVAAAVVAAEVAPTASAEVPDEIKALLAEWEPAPE